MAITLADLLDEKRVILGLRSRKVPNALREIIDLLAQNGKIDNPEAFFEKVLAREQAPRRDTIRPQRSTRPFDFRNRRSRTVSE
ncbi:MAG: hypothetical protein DME78_01165 [Verrucomicrobia bacterium]|nr:MAG: hypothetical protein DME78_01165 [Verrucomicrobiota bacterium]